jgi:hypothetical protein
LAEEGFVCIERQRTTRRADDFNKTLFITTQLQPMTG